MAKRPGLHAISSALGFVFLPALNQPILAAGLSVGLAALIVSCGSNRGYTPAPFVAPTPITAPSSTPETVLTQVTVSLPMATAGATPQPVALPTVAGYAPIMSLPLPQTATNAQLTEGVSNVAFSSLAPLSLARFMQSVRRAALPTDAAVLLYLQIYSSATLALPNAPGFTIVIPSADIFPGANYYLALYDPTRPSLGWQYDFEGPGILSGTTVTFAGNPNPFTFEAALSYYFALYVIPQSSTQPTPAPSTSPTSVPSQSPPPITTSPSPSPSPTGAGGTVVIVVPTPSPITCMPASVAVTVGQTLVLDCTSQDSPGPFTWTVADPTIASVQQSGVPFSLFNVTGLKVGTTTLSLRTQPGGAGSVTITVSP